MIEKKIKMKIKIEEEEKEEEQRKKDMIEEGEERCIRVIIFTTRM